MNIIKQYVTQNDCYKAGQKITPRGCMVHSTATPGVMAQAFALRWNQPGVEKAVHFFVDDADIIEILPCEAGNAWRAWHCGRGSRGSGNDTLVSLEMCESRDLKDKAYFDRVYENAAELAAHLARTFGFGAEDIICHSEGYTAGIASNHADVMHWFPKHSKSMDAFRAEVKAVLDRLEKPLAVNTAASWSADAVNWAVSSGLMAGDANGNLMLRSPLTREQFCVMLKRYHDQFHTA